MTGTAHDRTGSALLPGSLVGEYRISHKLGEGGMGVVYAGVHPEIGKRVAIKVLAPHAAERPDLIRRFKEEARAVNKIRHPNIIDIFAFNQLPDGRQYFVMEYLEGESLSARLARAPMDLGEARRLLGQICDALEAAHQAGVVHRDLKPDNVWVATEGTAGSRIKLLDFGIAKLSDLTNDKTTQVGTQLGTPHYMPPEQGMGQEIDRRADIYALGVVLYEMFAGVLPFNGATSHEIVLKHVTQAPLPPSRHRPIVPRDMEAIILACLEKTPACRPASARELGARIEAAFGHAQEVGAIPAVGTPRLPAAVANRTELLPGTRPIEGPTPFWTSPLLPPATTLRGATGDLATPSIENEPAGRMRDRGRWPAMFVMAAALAAAAIYVSGGRHAQPEPAITGSAAIPAAASTPPASAAIPAATAPPPEAPVVAPPPKITVRIESVPTGAKVIDASDGAVVGSTPFAVIRPRAVGTGRMRLELDGFEPRLFSLPLDASFQRTFELEKHPRTAVRPRPSIRSNPPAAPAPPAAAPPRPAPKKAPEIEWE